MSALSRVDLGLLATRANDAHQNARLGVNMATEAAVRAGQALTEAKAAVEHGSWAVWLAENFQGSERTAQLYMRLARDLPKLDAEKRNAVADLSLREAVRAIASRTTLQVMYSSGTPEWYTPAAVADSVADVLGGIDIDPSWHPQSPIVAQTTYTVEQNGLAQHWHGRVYLNPPYGREIDGWIEKLVRHHEAGDVTEAIALVPARVDTGWFRRLDVYPRCFVWGRLTFANAENPAPFPSAIVYLGPNVARFAETFGEIGGIFVKLAAEVRP